MFKITSRKLLHFSTVLTVAQCTTVRKNTWEMNTPAVPLEEASGLPIPLQTIFTTVFAWKIEHFGEMLNLWELRKRFYRSRRFVCGGVGWYLVLSHASNTKDFSQMGAPKLNEEIGLYLLRDYGNTRRDYVSITATTNLYFLDSQQRKRNSQRFVMTFPKEVGFDDTFRGATCFISNKSVPELQENASILFPGNTLKIGCDLSWTTVPEKEILNPPSFYQEIFNDPFYNDFKIELGNRTLHVSRILLTQHSSVFHAMFKNKSKEALCGTARIDEDIDNGIFEKVIKCMYTGVIPADASLDDLPIVKKWLIIINRYDFTIIGEILEKEIVNQLQPMKGIPLLVLTEGLGAWKLRGKIVQFIQLNWTQEILMQITLFCQTKKISLSVYTELIKDVRLPARGIKEQCCLDHEKCGNICQYSR